MSLPFGPTSESTNEVEALVSRKEAEWRRKGYPEHLIGMGKEMLREWVPEMKEAFMLTPEAVRERAVPFAERMADRWMERMYGAIKASTS